MKFSSSQPGLFDGMKVGKGRKAIPVEAVEFFTRRAGKVLSFEEAVRLFEEYRADLLDQARAIAHELGDDQSHEMAFGFVGFTMFDVARVMESRGILNEENAWIDRRFFGAVFSTKEMRAAFRSTGFRMDGDQARNSHATPCRVWRKVNG